MVKIGDRVVSAQGSLGTIVESIPFITGGTVEAGWDASFIPEYVVCVEWDRDSEMGKRWLHFYDPPTSCYPLRYLKVVDEGT